MRTKIGPAKCWERVQGRNEVIEQEITLEKKARKRIEKEEFKLN